LKSSKGEEDALKTKIEDLGLSVRTQKALIGASVRTIGGLSIYTIFLYKRAII